MEYAIAQLESSLYQAENNAMIHDAEGRKERAEHNRNVAKDLRTAIAKLNADHAQS